MRIKLVRLGLRVKFKGGYVLTIDGTKLSYTIISPQLIDIYIYITYYYYVIVIIYLIHFIYVDIYIIYIYKMCVLKTNATNEKFNIFKYDTF